NNRSHTDLYTLSLHDALPISLANRRGARTDLAHSSENLETRNAKTKSQPRQIHRTRQALERRERLVARHRAAIARGATGPLNRRSEEHTSELQSRSDLVCRLL